MKIFGFGERRKGPRRSKAAAPAEVTKFDRRKAERRKAERRQFFRLTYPAGSEPKVLNRNFRILNISQEGIKFICRADCSRCTQPIELNAAIQLKVQFHNGQILDLQVKLSRCLGELNLRQNCFAGLIEGAIAPEIISAEQAYLLRRFPEFCRSQSV